MSHDFLIRDIADEHFRAIKIEAKAQRRSINDQLNKMVEDWIELRRKGVVR